jgi:DNA (cytosine-5)-methyltransferase 1
MACDLDAHARATYRDWYGLEPLGDVTTIDADSVPEYDMVCAGFPCQPFSLAGQHKGFDDERGTMFSHVMRFVSRSSCKYLILENVAALLTHDGGKSMATIMDALSTAGYTTRHAVLKASDYGLPQMRKRLFIIGVRGTDVPEFPSPSPLPYTMTELLGKHFDEKTIAYTIRCGGRRSGLGDRHNWDTYLVDGHPYVLSIRDCLLLQGYPAELADEWRGSDSDKYKRLGNTIPTCLANAAVQALLDN